MRELYIWTILLVFSANVFALTIEAENARMKSVGARTEGGWNLYSNGQLGDFVRVEETGLYKVIVRARGSHARGVWPRMGIVVNGRSVKTVSVDRREFRDYTFELKLKAGVHFLAAAFTNDAVIDGEDRNLYLDRIVIDPPEGAPDPRLAEKKEVAMAAKKREDGALEKAQTDIEKHRKADAVVRVIDVKGKPIPGANVIADQTRHDFLFGCNIYMFDRFGTHKENQAYKQRFRDLFNYATTGFYWRGYEPERGKPSYEYTDRVVAWCREHGIRIKGHPLLWDHEAGRPKWSNDQQPPPDVQKQRVTDIVKRYSGKIELWEVVNEPSHCHRIKIAQPYRWAREADPNAYLIVNDYYVMADGYPPFFDLLQEAIGNGVPFDGVGIQAHEPRAMRFPLEQVQDILDRYATLGKELHITEYTPCSAGQPITGSHLTGTWDEAAQADYAVKFYTVCFAHPAVAAITWWDLCDRGAWLKGGGMLHADLTPKLVYTALKKLIHEDWHTRAEGGTDPDGRFSFRGYHGAYSVTATIAGKETQADLHLAKDEKNDLTVTVDRP